MTRTILFAWIWLGFALLGVGCGSPGDTGGGAERGTGNASSDHGTAEAVPPENFLGDDGIPDGPFAHPHLVAEQFSWIAGETHELGISFAIREGWHLYGNGVSDTGYPPNFELELPPGYTVGKALWPAPHRKQSPGGILDHVYTEEVTILVPVTLPPDAATGSQEITAVLDWLVCREACIPESDTVRMGIEILPPGSDMPNHWNLDAVLMDVARDRIPRDAGDALTITWDGATLVIQAADAVEMMFYPGLEAPPTRDLLSDGAAQGARLAVRFVPGQLDRPVDGVVEVVHANHPPALYRVRVPAPAAGKAD